MAPIDKHTWSLNEEEGAKAASIFITFLTHNVHAQQRDVKAKVNGSSFSKADFSEALFSEWFQDGCSSSKHHIRRPTSVFLLFFLLVGKGYVSLELLDSLFHLTGRPGHVASLDQSRETVLDPENLLRETKQRWNSLARKLRKGYKCAVAESVQGKVLRHLPIAVEAATSFSLE